jgi:choline dehydrogenase-like flavoprotein
MDISRRRFIKTASGTLAIGVAAGSAAPQVSAAASTPTTDFAQRVRVNQAKLTSELRPDYDFIICGSGPSGSVVARRLAENTDVSVLLLEAGGTDDVPSVMEAGQWHTNLGSDRDWGFQAQPNPNLNGRSIPENMGKVLGGGSSINAMVWAHGVTFEGKRATGVECIYNGKAHRISAGYEVVLSLGAIQTPKMLMQSGIGDEVELQRHGIPLVQHLPGVGQNFQDHPAIGCIWEYQKPHAPHAASVTFFWKSDPNLDTPDIQTCQTEVPFAAAEMLARYNVPAGSWSMFAGIVRPKSRGRVRLTGPSPMDAVQIETNMMSHPDDLKAAIACVQLCREIGNSDALRPFVKREVMPGNLKGAELENFIRDSVVTYWHQTCTAKMGRDAMSVVDANLKVYGIENLRIADGSIMPRVTTGNTMAPCVIIGERAGEILKAGHKL